MNKAKSAERDLANHVMQDPMKLALIVWQACICAEEFGDGAQNIDLAAIVNKWHEELKTSQDKKEML